MSAHLWPHVGRPIAVLSLSLALVLAGTPGMQRERSCRVVGVETAEAAGWRPDGHHWDINGTINAIALAPDGSAYIGGTFTQIDHKPRKYIAQIDAAGAVTSWNPSANGVVRSVVYSPYGPSGPVVYVGGDFSSIGGQPRSCIAQLDASGMTTGAATVWDPNAEDEPDPRSSEPGVPRVYSLAVCGFTVYAGGHFTSIGGAGRQNVAQLDALVGTATAWNAIANDEVRAVAVAGPTVYIGGAFTELGRPGPGPGGPPLRTRLRIAQLNASTGYATTWDASSTGPVYALAVSGSSLFVGGDFDRIGGESMPGIAHLDPVGLAINWHPPVSRSVYALGVHGGQVYAGGDFSGNLRQIDASDGRIWARMSQGDTVRAVAASGIGLFVGGDEGFARYYYEEDAIDLTDPTTTLLPTPASPNGENGWYSSVPTLTLTSNEPATIKYRLDGSGDYSTYAGPFSLTSDGTRTVEYYAVDSVANTESVKMATLKVDTHAPNGPMSLNGGATTTSSTVVDVESSVVETCSGRVEMRWNAGAGWTGWEEYAPTKMAVLPPLDGMRAVTCQYRDLAGNTRTLSDDIALDTHGPAAPSGFAATAASGQVELSWANPPDVDFASVRVVRTTTGLAPSPSSGTVVYEGTGVSHADSGVTSGTLYFYTAFPRDALGNWGTRAGTAALLVAPNAQKTTALTAAATPLLLNYDGAVTVSGRLTAQGSELGGRTDVTLWASNNEGADWTRVSAATAAGSTYSAVTNLARNTHLQLRFAGDAEYAPCVSARIVYARVKAQLSAPTVPRKVKRKVTATFTGTLAPRHSGKTQVELWRKVGSKYVKYKTLQASNGPFGSITKWTLKVKLPRTGTWRIRSLHSDEDHAPSASTYVSFKVR